MVIGGSSNPISPPSLSAPGSRSCYCRNGAREFARACCILLLFSLARGALRTMTKWPFTRARFWLSCRNHAPHRRDLGFILILTKNAFKRYQCHLCGARGYRATLQFVCRFSHILNLCGKKVKKVRQSCEAAVDATELIQGSF